MTNSTDTVLSAEFISEVMEHMNSDHAESLKHYAEAFADVDWADSVQLISLTVTGISLECQSVGGRKESARIEFAQPLRRPEQVRGALVAMARQARLITEKRSK